MPSWGEVPETERDADDQISATLSPETTERLSALCKSAGATLADGFNLGWGLVMWTINRADDVVFSTITSGRDGYSTEVSDLVGLFINPVPVRVNPDKQATARQALATLNRQAAATRPYDFCPLADIQNALGGDIRLSGLIISFENYSEGEPGEVLLRPAFIREEHEAGSVDVDASVRPDGSISMLLSYDPALYRGSDIARLMALFENCVERMTEMARLCQALEQVLAAHPFLSMTIGYDDNGEAVAKRSDDVNVRIERLDDLPAIDALVRPFDLTGGEPLCRVALIDGPEGKYLFLDTHHIVSDGESINILFEDINAAYAGGAVETERYTGFEFALDEQPRGLRSISRRHGRGMRANAGALKTRPCHCGRRICTRRIPSRPGGRAVRRMPKPCGPTALSTA